MTDKENPPKGFGRFDLEMRTKGKYRPKPTADKDVLFIVKDGVFEIRDGKNKISYTGEKR